MVFLLLVVFGFSTKPLTMIRLFAELSGHYLFFGLPLLPVDHPSIHVVQAKLKACSGGRGRDDP
jgi:hypothetical protein